MGRIQPCTDDLGADNGDIADGLRVFQVEHGKAVFATKAFKKGDIAFEEDAIASSQHFYSRKVTTACEGCLRTLGSLRTRLGKILQANQPNALFLETDFPEIATDSTLDDPHFSREGMKYEKITACDCGRDDCRVVYCSEKCRETRGITHRMVAKGEWSDFFKYAAKYHENIKIGLYLLLCPRRGELQGLYNPSWTQLENIEQKWIDLRKKILHDSYEMLKKGWVYAETDQIQLCSIDEWDRILGIVDFTSKDLRSVNQANIQLVRARRSEDFQSFYWDNAMFWTKVCEIGHHTQVYWANTEEHTHPHQFIEKVDESDILTAFKKSGNVLPDIEALGIFRCLAFLNHSCYPNVEVSCRGNDRIRARVLRDIEPGEEILMSYLDEDDPLESRQKATWVDYIFRCRCVKCRVQTAIHILQIGVKACKAKNEYMVDIIEWMKQRAKADGLDIRAFCEETIRCSPCVWVMPNDESATEDEPLNTVPKPEQQFCQNDTNVAEPEDLESHPVDECVTPSVVESTAPSDAEKENKEQEVKKGRSLEEPGELFVWHKRER